MKRLLVVVCVAVIGLLAWSLLHDDMSSDALTPCVTVHKGDFDVAVATVGELDTTRAYRVASEIRGNKGKIIDLVKDGIHVVKNDVLVRFDPTPFEQKVVDFRGKIASLTAVSEAADKAFDIEKNRVNQVIKNSKFDVKQRKQALLKLTKGEGPVHSSEYESDALKAKSKLSEQKSFVKALIALNKKGFSNASELVRAKKKLLSLQKMFDIANKKYEIYQRYMLPSLIKEKKSNLAHAKSLAEQIKQGGVARIAQARAMRAKARQDLQNTQDELQRALDELDKTTIHAPFDGIVVLIEGYYDGVRRKPRVGDGVIQNAPILSLPDTSGFVVYTKVREIDLHKVSINQKVEVRVDAFPDILLVGNVSSIGALAQKEVALGGAKYFHLTITLEQNDSRLRPGMTVRSTIISTRVRNAVMVPQSVLFTDHGKTVAYRCDNGQAINLKLGQHNVDWFQIADGLHVNDRVRMSPPESDY